MLLKKKVKIENRIVTFDLENHDTPNINVYHLIDIIFCIVDEQC